LCGGSKSVSSRSVAIVMTFCRIGRAHRGLHGDHPTAGGPGLHRRAQRQRPERERRTAGGGYFVSRCKAGFRPAAENSRRPPLPTRAACRPIALLKAASAARSGKGASPVNRCDRQAEGRAAHFIVPFRPRPSISGIEARLAGQAARARLFEDDPHPDGGGLR
jgi:hypothetical protein